MPTKLFRTINCDKKYQKRVLSFAPVEAPANPRADLLIQERKEFDGKK